MAGPPGRVVAPPKPWERVRANDGPSPFAPPSNANSTAAVVAAAGTSTSGPNSSDQKVENGRNVSITDAGAPGRPMPPRPWEQNRIGYATGPMSSYGGYGGGMYGGGLGSSTYGGGLYGGGLGSSMYGGGYGSSYGGMSGGMYGNRYGGSYGGYGGMTGGHGAGYGGYGMGGMGVGFGAGPGDPNFPGGPPQPPGVWQSLLQGGLPVASAVGMIKLTWKDPLYPLTVVTPLNLSGVMQFFGRLAMLVNENTQAFHFFISALLQLCDRAGSLYGELARFVLHILGYRMGSKARARSKASARALEAGVQMQPGTNLIAAPAPEKAWENVWTDEGGPAS